MNLVQRLVHPGTRARARRRTALAGVLLTAFAGTVLTTAPTAHAATYVPISGAGSTWSYNALDSWRKNVEQYGMKVNFSANGSSDGRNQFKNRTVDFAVSEIPYGLKDGNVTDTPPPAGSYAYMPIVAGGTALMYNLTIGTSRVTNLRLSPAVVAGIFTGKITMWNDPAIAADNPSLALPARKVVPVVRSDGSGTSAQFTAWMAAEQTALWNDYAQRAGRGGGQTSNYPTIAGSGFISQAGSNGVAGYVKQAQNVGTITYVEYSYALNAGYPVAKVLNKADYYVEPTPSNTAVGLLGAKIDTNPASPQYLTADLTDVYRNADKRAYPLSSYSYMIVPTRVEGTFNENKGSTLGAFSYYFLCEGQQGAPRLGYSPLPINLVQAGLDQVKKIPGVDVQNIDIRKCNNPTFSADGTNTLAKNAPMPSECDKRGVSQCTTGTGGAKKATKGKPGSQGGESTDDPADGGVVAGTGTPSSEAAPGSDAPAAVDIDTGEVVAAGDTGAGSDVAATAVSLSSDAGPGLQRTAMVGAAVLLMALMFAPPLLARRLAGRKEESS